MATLHAQRSSLSRNDAAAAAVGHKPRAVSDTAVEESWATLIAIIQDFAASGLPPEGTHGISPARGHISISSSSKRNERGSDGDKASLLRRHMSVVQAGGLVDVLQAYVLSVLDRKVREEVAPRFWGYMLHADPVVGSTGSRSRGRSTQSGMSALHPESMGRSTEDFVVVRHDDGTDGEGEQEREREDVEDTDAPPSTTPKRKDLYVRVKRALLYVAGEVRNHLILVRLLDDAAFAASLSPAPAAASSVAAAQSAGNVSDMDASREDQQPFRNSLPGARTAAATPRSIEGKYHCAFTAQVMAGAKGDFQGTMRAFFDRNIRFWHRTWLEERRRRRHGEPQEDRRQEEEREDVQGTEGEGMDVSDDEGSQTGADATSEGDGVQVGAREREIVGEESAVMERDSTNAEAGRDVPEVKASSPFLRSMPGVCTT